MKSADTNQVPTHLGLILDGNRRWAKEHGLNSLAGHKKGYQNLKKIALGAFDRNIKYVSAFVFSSENWLRSTEEVTYLMDLFQWVAKYEVAKFNKENVRVVFIGSKNKLSDSVRKSMRDTEEKTAKNTGGILVLCLNYGGQQEISEAVANIIKSGASPDDVSPELISSHLYYPSLPPLDFIIRTSGEKRLSGFMLWQSAYAELGFVDKHWPAFTVKDLDLALEEYSNRQRRFGT